MTDDINPFGTYYLMFKREQEQHKQTWREREIAERIVKIILDDGYVCGKAWKVVCDKECLTCLTNAATEQLEEEGLI